MTPLLNIENLSVQYRSRDQSTMAVKNVSMEIPNRGYTVGLVGESGSGKTTLASSIMKLIEPPGEIISGKIEFEGNDVLAMSKQQMRRYRWHSVAMVYQSAMNSFSPVKTVSDHIVEVLRQHLEISKSEARERALKLLTQVGIPSERTDAYPHELSGGMKQRGVIAMALALSPALLIADEPTSALDVVVQRQILTLLRDYIVKQNLSLIFVTHEISILEGLVENIVVMHKGRIVEIGPAAKILYHPLHPYSEKLLGSLLTLSTDKSVLLSAAPVRKRTGAENGCNYADECSYFMERCAKSEPELSEVEAGRWVACYKQGS